MNRGFLSGNSLQLPSFHPRIGRSLPQLDYLIQAPAYISEGQIRQPLERMRLRTARTPVEGFWLVAEYITGFSRLASTFGLSDGNGKRVIDIVFRCSHGRADNQGCGVVEIARRKHQKWVHIAHFLPCLGIAIDPDDIPPSRHPRAAVLSFLPGR